MSVPLLYWSINHFRFLSIHLPNPFSHPKYSDAFITIKCKNIHLSQTQSYICPEYVYVCVRDEG